MHADNCVCLCLHVSIHVQIKGIWGYGCCAPRGGNGACATRANQALPALDLSVWDEAERGKVHRQRLQALTEAGRELEGKGGRGKSATSLVHT